jgi:hypothetical protein
MMACIPGTKELLQYNNSTGTVGRKTIQFPALTSNIFLNNCAWINHNEKLYISGGENSNGTYSSQFLCYDFRTEELIRLADLLTSRHSHSMVCDGDFIYVVGGYNNSSCEKYDLKGMKWIKLNNLFDERRNPVLHIYKNFLYCFFGVKNNQYTDTVERLNIKNTSKAKWEIVAYKNPSNMDLKIMGCGIVEVNEHEIFLFGGKKADTIKKDLFKFNFINYTFTPLAVLEDEVYFHESHLIPIGDKTFAQFSLGKTDHFFKAQIV